MGFGLVLEQSTTGLSEQNPLEREPKSVKAAYAKRSKLCFCSASCEQDAVICNLFSVICFLTEYGALITENCALLARRYCRVGRNTRNSD